MNELAWIILIALLEIQVLAIPEAVTAVEVGVTDQTNQKKEPY